MFSIGINVLTYKASHALFGKNGMNKPLCWATHQNNKKKKKKDKLKRKKIKKNLRSIYR